MNTLINNIFNINTSTESQVIQQVFEYQYAHNKVYQQWCNLVKNENQFQKSTITPYPFLPISFFKTHKIISGNFSAQQIFESSGTTQTINSQHFIKDIEIYKQSFLKTFINTYGNIDEYCIIGLLPSYLERQNSSLVFMVDELIRQSKNSNSGFYLYNFTALHELLSQLELQQKKTIIIGVTFALLDFAEQFNMKLQHTTIIETGGMKGRKKEMTKQEVHSFLQQKLGLQHINSEYGMTELLSQAYATTSNKHTCPAWMKVCVRDEEDPFDIKPCGKGIINIIDLANLHSCSFIATDDVGEVFEDGSFEIIGRLDNSDLRGCSLLWL